MTKEEESGERVMHVGMDFDYGARGVSGGEGREGREGGEGERADLFELVEVCCAFVGPQPGDVSRQLKWLRRSPVLNEPRLVRRYNRIEAVAILYAVSASRHT